MKESGAYSEWLRKSSLVNPMLAGHTSIPGAWNNAIRFMESKAQQLKVEISALTDEVECLAVVGIHEVECQNDIVKRLRKLSTI
jgi:hypothetical protein